MMKAEYLGLIVIGGSVAATAAIAGVTGYWIAATQPPQTINVHLDAALKALDTPLRLQDGGCK